MGKELIIAVLVGLIFFSFAGCRPEDDKKTTEAEKPAEKNTGRGDVSSEEPAGSEGTEETSDPAETDLQTVIAEYEPEYVTDSDFSDLPSGFPGDRGGDGAGDSGKQTSIVSHGSIPSGGDGVARIYDYRVDVLGWTGGTEDRHAGPGYVFFTESSVEGIGGNPELVYYLIPEDNVGDRVPVQAAFNIAELMDTGEYENIEELEKQNEEMARLAEEILAEWDPSPIETALPDEFDVFVTGNKAQQTEEEFTEWRLIFNLRHMPTGQSKPFARFEMWCTGPETLTYRHGRVSPTGRSIVLRIRTPMVMEFVPESDLLYVIGPEFLAQYFNEVGFEYYKAEQYEEASYYFQSALRCRPEHVLAAYNAACMEALQENPAGALFFLSRLKEIGTEEAYTRIKKAKSDGDFGPVRDDPAFKSGWKELTDKM
jgi:hypothetical protein